MPLKNRVNMKTKYLFFACLVFIAGCIAIEPTARIEFSAPESYPEASLTTVQQTRIMFLLHDWVLWVRYRLPEYTA